MRSVIRHKTRLALQGSSSANRFVAYKHQGFFLEMQSLFARAARAVIGAGMLMLGAAGMPQNATAASGCAPANTVQTDVIAVMDNLLAALRTDSQDLLQQVTTADFYAYDGGMRLYGPALLELIKQGHAKGARWVWSVTEPEVHWTCNLAWITYVNRGSVEDASGINPQSWLESGILEYAGGRWRLRFLHSTRVPKPS